jgi:two-component system phosphate regulon sensor histidine kinase PhoR
MWSPRFLWKLFLGYAVLIVLTASLVGVMVSRQIGRDTLADVDLRLRNEATLLRDFLPREPFSAPNPRLQSLVEATGRETETRLTLLRPDGVVVADSEEDPAHMENHGRRPEILQANEEGLGRAARLSVTTGQTLRYLALPVLDGDHLAGYVRVALPLTKIDARRARLRKVILLSTAVAILFGLVLSFLFARQVTRPLRSMTTVAQSLAAGDYDRRVPIDTEDEVGDLGRAFNRMASELETRVATLDHERQLLLAVFGSMVEGVIALDSSQQILHMNQSAGRILGLAPEDCLGRTIWEVARYPAVGEAVRQAMEGGASSGEARISVEASNHILELRAAPLPPGGAVLVFYDLTDLHHLQEVRRDFVANVSHELKTPVTAIIGLIETILDDTEMPAPTRDRFLDKVRQHGQRLSALVTDLLALSRLEAGDRYLERAPSDLRAAVGEAIRSQSAAAETGQVELRATLPDEAVIVQGDPEALREAVENLLSNAIRYTPKNGAVDIRLIVDHRGATVEVADQGPGIEPRHQERIFERFYRIDRARSRELGGTGLGLSIVKHTALAHEGRVAVESQPGKGSVFRLWLPRVG